MLTFTRPHPDGWQQQQCSAKQKELRPEATSNDINSKLNRKLSTSNWLAEKVHFIIVEVLLHAEDMDGLFFWKNVSLMNRILKEKLAFHYAKFLTEPNQFIGTQKRWKDGKMER